MPTIENFSPFSAVALPALTKEGLQVLVTIVAGRFRMPRAGAASNEAPVPTEEQVPPCLADVYSGEPGSSSLKYEGQSGYTRPGTDVYLIGQAWAPRGRPTPAMMAGVRVGKLAKEVLVVGDRFWQRGILGMTFSLPKRFTTMPLLYERAFGGMARRGDKPPVFEPRNPVGRGLYADSKAAADQPLPNLEDPQNRVAAVKDRPRPAALGPVARSWQPRVNQAGTNDHAWQSARAPLWPLDFDERFFCAASPGLVAAPHLIGGEPVVLTGVSPDGPIRFPLPSVRLVAKARFRACEVRRAMALDALLFEPDAGTLTLTWRCAVPAPRGLLEHESTVVRELEPWEEAPT